MSTPFARTYAPTTYRSPAAQGVLATASPTRLTHWTLARGLGLAAQVLLFAITAGQVSAAALIVAEIAACVLAMGAAEAIKSASSAAQPHRLRYARGLSEIGLQCAVAVAVIWLMTR